MLCAWSAIWAVQDVFWVLNDSFLTTPLFVKQHQSQDNIIFWGKFSKGQKIGSPSILHLLYHAPTKIYTIFCSNMYATHQEPNQRGPDKVQFRDGVKDVCHVGHRVSVLQVSHGTMSMAMTDAPSKLARDIASASARCFQIQRCHQCLQKGITMATCSMFASRAAMSWFPSRCYCLHFSLVGMSECLRVAKNPWFVCRVFEQIDAREPGHFHLGPQCILQCRKVARCSSVAALFAAKGLNLKACSGNYSTIFHIHVSLCNVDWFFNVFLSYIWNLRMLCNKSWRLSLHHSETCADAKMPRIFQMCR